MRLIYCALCSLAATFFLPCANALAADSDTIRLSTGEMLQVTILEVSDTSVRFRHSVLGEITLPRSSVEVIVPPPADAETPAGTTAAPAPPRSTESQTTAPSTEPTAGEPSEEPASQPEPPPKEWNFRLVLAAASNTGNTESADFSTIFTAKRETERIKTLIDASYFFSESDGETSENRFSTGVRNDWLNPGSKWFWFADARFDYDEFNSWRERLTGHVGLGYHLVTPPKLRLDLLAGIGAIKEWGSDNDDVRPEALFGVDGQYAFNDKHTLTFNSTVYPEVTDINTFRWTNSVAWAWTIDKETDLALTAGVMHEYQSQVDPGRDKNDVRLYAGVQLDF